MIGRENDAEFVTTGRRSTAVRPGSATHTEGIAAVVSGCEKQLREAGIIGALRFLNERTRYRYTGLYHTDPPMLHNVQLFDRENPTLNVSGDSKPLHETFCGIVRDANDTVLITDALADARYVTHPARESVLSYCGVPIRTADGLPWGSLCHFDVRPRLLSGQEALILQGAAALFAHWLSDQQS